MDRISYTIKKTLPNAKSYKNLIIIGPNSAYEQPTFQF
jgi:hypothetical protein